MEGHSAYLMRYLGMNRSQLSEFLSQPEVPSGNMHPPPYVEEPEQPEQPEPESPPGP